MKIGKKITLVLATIMLIVGCSNNNTVVEETKEDNSTAKDQQIQIYTSIYPVFDLAQKIAGDRAEVINIVPPGGDSHDYEPSPKDIIGISEADMFMYNGGGYERWIEKVLESVNTSNLTVLDLSESVSLLTYSETEGQEHSHDEAHGEEAGHEDEHGHGKEAGHEDEHGHGKEAGHEEHGHEEAGHEDTDLQGSDPHYWLDPIRMKDVASSIKNALIEKDPEGKQAYDANYNNVIAELDVLHQEFESVAQTASTKDVIVSHAAFGYLMNRYGLKQIPISGLSPSDEPSQKELEEIITFAKENNVKYIMFETIVDIKVAEVVRDQIGAEALTLNPLEGLTKEELSEGKDYFSIMRENLESLKIALGSE